MFEMNHEPQKGKVNALVNIGASVININIVRNGNSVFTRDMSIGGNHFTEEIQKQLNVSFEEAEQLKLNLGGGGEREGEIREVIDSISSSIALEIQRSLDFFTATSSVGHISKVFIVGGASKTPGLKEIVENQIGIPVEAVNPFNSIEINPKNFDLEYIKDISPTAGVAVGLALRRVGDK
jgi:type IV pilus assembly protein PilM